MLLVLIGEHIDARSRPGYYGYGYYGPDRYDYSPYERFSYHGFWGNYGYAYQPWWSK